MHTSLIAMAEYNGTCSTNQVATADRYGHASRKQASTDMGNDMQVRSSGHGWLVSSRLRGASTYTYGSTSKSSVVAPLVQSTAALPPLHARLNTALGPSVHAPIGTPVSRRYSR